MITAILEFAKTGVGQYGGCYTIQNEKGEFIIEIPIKAKRIITGKILRYIPGPTGINFLVSDKHNQRSLDFQDLNTIPKISVGKKKYSVKQLNFLMSLLNEFGLHLAKTIEGNEITFPFNCLSLSANNDGNLTSEQGVLRVSFEEKTAFKGRATFDPEMNMEEIRTICS